MGIQINGQTDTISATDGSFTISGASGNLTGNLTGNVTGNLTGNVTSSGISTFSDTVNVGAGKSIRLYGATSGFTEIVAAAGSASTTFTLPANGGSASQYLQTDGAGVLSWQTVTSTNTFGFTSLGETATTSGSGSTVSGIPSNATEVIIILSDISCSNTTTPHLLLQLGDGSIDTGNNYRWSISYGGSYQATGGQPHIRLIDTDASGTGNVYSGIIRIIPGTSNIQGHFVTHYHNGTSVWGVFLYTGGTTLDRVSISSASVFDQGKYEVLHNGQS